MLKHQMSIDNRELNMVAHTPQGGLQVTFLWLPVITVPQ